MKMQLTENEEKIMNILNYKDDINDIWTTIQEVLTNVTMDINELELSLYLLQMKRLIRVSMDEFGAIKLTTEEKVSNKLNSRITEALTDMKSAETDAVENEDYEEAAKLRDWVLMAKDPSRQDELIKSLLEDIDE